MKKVIITLLFTGLILTAKAQDNTTEKSNYTIVSIVPQYLIMNGLRVDFEKHLNKSNWLVIAPQFYVAEKNNEYDDTELYWDNYYNDYYNYDDDYDNNTNQYDMLVGGGIDLLYKITFPISKENSENVFFGYGITYQYFYIEYMAKEWVESSNNGLTQYELAWAKKHESINKAGINMLIGIQKDLMEDKLYGEVYFGLGLRYSNISGVEKEDSRFNDGFIEYGYTGTLPVAGVKFGIKF